MPRTSNGNGVKSNGTKSRKGKLTILSANAVNGGRCWSPVLPAIETEEDWQARLAAVTASPKPGSYLEEQLAIKPRFASTMGSLTVTNARRLHPDEGDAR